MYNRPWKSDHSIFSNCYLKILHFRFFMASRKTVVNFCFYNFSAEPNHAKYFTTTSISFPRSMFGNDLSMKVRMIL